MSRMTGGGRSGRTEGEKESLRVAQKIFLCGILGRRGGWGGAQPGLLATQFSFGDL